MNVIGDGVYKFDSSILAVIATVALGRNSKTSIVRAFKGRTVEITDGERINSKTSSFIAKTISQKRCCKVSAEAVVAQSPKNDPTANPQATLTNIDQASEENTGLSPLQLIPELQGLALKPEDADQFLEVLTFDGVGNIIGTKRELSDSEIEEVKRLAIAPLHLTNSSGERTHSRTPVDSLLYLNHFLENSYQDGMVIKWQGNIREFWLRGNMSADRVKSFFQLALKDFKGDLVISQKINMLLKDLEKEKHPAQLYDNMFGRIFSSELGRELVENPTKESLETARMIAHELKQDVATFSAAQRQVIVDYLRDDIRFWFPKCPSIGVFMDDPTLDNLNNCLSKIENGFDVIKISRLLMCVQGTKNFAQIGAPYLSKANQFYNETLLKIRKSDNVLSSSVKDGGVNGEPKQVTVTQDRFFETNSYGSKLRYHPKNEQGESDFIYSKSQPDMKSLNHENSSTFEQNMLRSGHSFGLGISGTTNLSCFLYEDMAKKYDGFSKNQAFLNTLAFVLYDGGHSIAESLAVFKAIGYLEQESFNSDAEKYDKGKQIIESSLVNFKDLVGCGNAESQGHIMQSLNRAYDAMTKSYGKHAYSAIKRDS